MSDTLIEAVARAMWERRTKEQYDEPITWEQLAAPYRALSAKDARAAIAAIEASGTHRVVPVEPTRDMIFSGGDAPDYSGVDPIGENTAELIYRLMLDAAPKVAP